MEANGNSLPSRSAVEGWSKATPGVAKWTKATVGQHITVGGLGATPVGTPEQVADNMEKWVQEADVDGFNLVRLSHLRLDLCFDSDSASIRRTRSSQAHSRISSTCSSPSSVAEVSSGMIMRCTRERTARTCMDKLVSRDRRLIIQLRSTGGMLGSMLQLIQSLKTECVFPTTSCTGMRQMCRWDCA